ncbi:FecR domain-containing protein [Roseateles sp. SL47]|uniref:FecR family protein n=1 Tax=Roseateles sp. SL47 TaxID=2995138 RepID=UPI00226D54DA|nr:FecR domain-containing protein [Roseateles sp. SL47]WAC71027.1 FecR domain-containing protein [Roseateles sp. SL47]
MRGDLAVAEEAAEWIVRLSADADEEREAARRGFDAWKRADPRHAAVAADMEHFVEQTRRLAGPATELCAARAALDAVLPPQRRSRRGAVSMALLLTAAIGGVAWLSADLPAPWLADLHTAVGEQRSQRLADGTMLTLSSDSAVDYQWGADLRRVSMRGGEILLDVAKDARRPLVVDTPEGRIRALGTRFIVRRDGDATVLTMLESSTAVSLSATPGGPTRPAEAVVSAGQQVRLSAHGLERLSTISPGIVEDAFKLRRLVAQDRPLSEVLDELARNRRGLIRYDKAAVRGLRVTAVLPLDDTDRALQLLAASFPQLQVRVPTRWLVLVDVRR